MCNPRRFHGFTLIELLVVVTIIVVLLSLLMPALDKAIYQAELVSCSARLRGIGTSLAQYAAGNKRAYPVFDPYGAGVQPANIKGPIGGGGAGNSDTFDYRKTVRAYMALKALTCPLAGSFDLEVDTSQWMWTTYDVRAGFRFMTRDILGNVTSGLPGMMRIGDRWQWTDTFSSTPGRTYDFNIIVSDIDSRSDNDDGQRSSSSHPDYGDNAKLGVSEEHDQLYEFRLWAVPKDGMRRGTADYNFAYQDGSALTLPQVKPPPPDGDDSRVARVPSWGDTQKYKDGHFRQVPKP